MRTSDKLWIALIWIIMGTIFVGFVYAGIFGEDANRGKFGTAVFGSGDVTTSVYVVPDIMPKIIGGGLVGLEEEYRFDKSRTHEYMLYDKLIEEDGRWEELED